MSKKNATSAVAFFINFNNCLRKHGYKHRAHLKNYSVASWSRRPPTARKALFLSSSVKSFLRKRMLFGVTSTSSSLLIKSRAFYNENLTGGTKTIASSVPEARTLVSCLPLRAFTVRSLSRLWIPTIWPS